MHLPPRALGAIERRPITQLVLPPPSSLIENHLCGRNAGTESRSSLITERRASSHSVCHTASVTQRSLVLLAVVDEYVHFLGSLHVRAYVSRGAGGARGGRGGCGQEHVKHFLRNPASNTLKLFLEVAGLPVFFLFPTPGICRVQIAVILYFLAHA